jgi:hypothetical protein
VAQDIQVNLNPLPEEGEPMEYRLTDASKAQEIANWLKQVDQNASRERAAIQAQIDGSQPYDQKKREENGQGQLANINFLEAWARIGDAAALFVDLINAVRCIGIPRTRFGSPEEREEWEAVMAEEFHETVVNVWEGFHYAYYNLCLEFLKFGFGVGFWDDDKDWRWRPLGLQDFKIERGTDATENSLDIAVSFKRYSVTQLYSYIRNEEYAKQMGWDCELVRKAIIECCNGMSSAMNQWYDWEAIQAQIKANSFYYDNTDRYGVALAHYYVKEWDGSVSHLITHEEMDFGGFLYKRYSEFESLNQTMVIFTYGVGTNGQYHSIRGLGQQLFAPIQLINRSRCAMIDMSLTACQIGVIPQTQDDASKLEPISCGPFLIFPAGTTFGNYGIPNVGQNAMPVINELSNVVVNNTGSYQNRTAPVSSVERTKFEVQSELSNQSQLGQSMLNLFYTSWKKLLTEKFRRMAQNNICASDPGGKMAIDFIKRCLNRGVPRQAIEMVYTVEPEKAIGYGSPQARLLAFDRVSQMMAALDDTGRTNLIRDMIASSLGYNAVDRYMPKLGEKRGTQDDRNAEFENAAMRGNSPAQVFNNDNHLVHLRVHLSDVVPILTAIEQGQADPQQFMDYLISQLGVENEPGHSGIHLQMIKPWEGNKQEAAQLGKIYQQARAAFSKIFQQIQAQMQQQMEAMQEQAAQQQAQGGQVDPDLQMKMQKHELEMQILSQKAELNNAIKTQEFQSRQASRDIITSKKLEEMAAKEKLERNKIIQNNDSKMAPVG